MEKNEKSDVQVTCPSRCWEQIKDILEEEANVLARVLDNGKTDAALKDSGFPHRVNIAIHREITRLRVLAASASIAPNPANLARESASVDQHSVVGRSK